MERWKSSISGCLISWPRIKKMVDLKCLSSLTVHSNNKQFRNLIVTCDKKWILYNWWRPAQLVDRGAASKHFPKPNLHQKKVMVAVWQSAASMIHYSFLNSGKTMTSEKYTQQIGEIFWKLLYLQPTVVNRKGPIFSTTKPNCMLHNQRFKSWMKGLQSFAPCAIFTRPHANQLPFFMHLDSFFVGKTLPRPGVGRKCFPRVHQTLKHGFLHHRNRQIYFSLTKMCWL